MDVRVGLRRKLSAEKLMLLNCGVGEDSWESLGLQGDPTSPSWRRSVLGVHLEGLMLKLKLQYFDHLMRRVDSFEKTLMLGGIGDRRRKGQQKMRWLDGITTQWTWVWVSSGSLWWTGRPGMLQFMGSQRVGQDWVNELTEPRQHIKKQRHYFANKGLSGQGYGFSSGDVWMLELDCEESWVLKNWCFCTVVLGKTLESPLDCKEIQPVLPKGDQSWVFIWKDWCWSWNSSALATSWEELTYWKRPCCWEGLGAGGEGDDRG